MICNGSKIKNVKEGKFSLVHCNTCGVKYHYPIPSVLYLTSWYSKHALAKRWKGNILNAVNANYKQNRGNYIYYLKLIEGIPIKGTVLDIGCYAGHFLTHLIKRGFKGIGIDLNAGLVEYGKKTFGIDLRHGDLLDLKFESNYFDLITCHQVLEHVRDPHLILKEVRRILKPNGFIAVSVPDAAHVKKISYPEHLFHFTKISVKHLFSRLFSTYKINRNPKQKALFVLGRKNG